VNAKDVMDEIGAKLDTISELRVYPYDIDKVTPPAAIVGLPELVTYDDTYARGMDSYVMPLFVMVSRANLRAATEALAAYLDGSGARSVKSAVDSSSTNEYTACDSVRVTQGVPFADKSGGIDVLGVRYEIEVSGSGS
jgi:hypothetical protein